VKLIKDGAFPPGSRLPGERELAEQLDVSRVTIREAEIALQALGYIRIKTGSGAYVLDRSKHDDGSLPQVSALELTEARSLIESEAAALAANNIDDETLQKLRAYIGTMSSDNPGDEAASQLADRDFHLAIAAASGNAAVRHVVQILWKMRTELAPVREVHDSVCSAEPPGVRGLEHTEILDALRKCDPAAARFAMRKHFRRLLESMLEVTEEQAFAELRRKATESRKRFLRTANL